MNLCGYLVRQLLVLVCSLIASASVANDRASELFANLSASVFQVRVIDVASGDKSSIGSGFQVGAEGYVVTNFHVIASRVHEPTKHRLEIVRDDGTTIAAELVTIDVVRDLAILQADTGTPATFQLRPHPPALGERVYSMGNPQDLGMTIIEGNYNGPVKLSRFQKLLFSGSLNPGMSGGPAIDREGAVIGVNVSKGGEQLSFLVPASEVERLLQRAQAGPSTTSFDLAIREALYADQDSYFKKLLAQDWPAERFGEISLPQKISPWLKCWGHTVDDEKLRYESFHQHCRSEDDIYIRPGLALGALGYDYEWMTSGELNRWQFYEAVESRFAHRGQFSAYQERDVTEYECHTGFVTLAALSWKASTCFRAYKAYAGLVDVLLLLASVSHSDRVAIVKFGASGVSEKNALAVVDRMLRSVRTATP